MRHYDTSFNIHFVSKTLLLCIKRFVISSIFQRPNWSGFRRFSYGRFGLLFLWSWLNLWYFNWNYIGLKWRPERIISCQYWIDRMYCGVVVERVHAQLNITLLRIGSLDHSARNTLTINKCRCKSLEFTIIFNHEEDEVIILTVISTSVHIFSAG